MRQLIIQVPDGYAQTVMEIASQHQAMNVWSWSATSPRGPADMVMMHVSNQRVEGVLAAIEKVPKTHITLIPRDVIALKPPAAEAPDQVIDVGLRSPIEVFLAGLQSIGSWQGFLGYTIAGAVVVWISLFTNSPSLLVAAMLIAPFGGPAMNTAIGTARGDFNLMKRSLFRYAVALITAIMVSAALSFVLGQDHATNLMTDVTTLSSVMILLPLVAGASGALNLMQSEHDSLVAGAAIGMLVAIAISPPAGVIGMALVIGEWEMVLINGFVLVVQLAAINLSGALVFRLLGLNSHGTRYTRGKNLIFYVATAITIVIIAVLLMMQFSSSPELQRATISRRAAGEAVILLRDYDQVKLIEVEAHFVQGSVQGQHSLLMQVYVQRHADTTLSNETLQAEIERQIRQQLADEDYDLTPLIDVTIFNPTDASLVNPP